MSIEDKIKELGISLSDIPKPLGSYKPAVRSGNLLFVSGQLPLVDGKLLFEGKVDDQVTLEKAAMAARQCAVNSLSIMKGELGDLNNVARIVKVTGYIASSAGFHMQANVLNGASDLYFEIFGEKGVHARAAVGVYELPVNSPVEVEVIVEIKS